MMRCYNISYATTLLLLLVFSSFIHLSAPNPVGTLRPKDDPNGPTASENRENSDDKMPLIQREGAQEEEELFKDVDPKKLAAVLLEALNQSHVQTRWKNDNFENEEEEERKASTGDVHSKTPYSKVGSLGRSDRDRGGREELELLMAANGKAQEKAEEEEKAKAQEEEDKMTEKVTSRTTSQTVQIQRDPPSSSSDGGEGNGQASVPQESTRPGHGSHEEEEEQLNPEELKSLERMMKEFPPLNTAVKREGGSEPNQRESRGYTSYNEVLPAQKSGDLAMSKKMLKWREETQKAVYFPTFKEGNFMDDFEDSNDGSNAAQPQLPAEQKVMDEEEEEEEELSLEEEEARAKAEQEEMRRQAAEVQKAKMEEEKLADIASDMLLRYMVKQNNGNQKNSLSVSNAMEDKRSEEEQVTEEDDIDPQTIDKLIEISSKLHLPADDVVDIISDVEKKKRKDMPLDTSRWQRPQSLQSSSSSASQLSANHYNFPVAKQPFRGVNLLKSWLQEKTPGQAEDFWRKQDAPLAGSVWAKDQPLSIKSQKSFWSGYPNYLYTFPPHYQRKPYPYYPVFYPPPMKPRYYISKPALGDGSFLWNTLPPKRHYQSWIQPRLRKPPTYSIPYPLTFQSVPISKPLTLPRRPVFLSKPKDAYDPASVPPLTETRERSNLERLVQQILMRRPQVLD
ncbi:neurosecretory protein VGF [Gouania willdenowi]|uniref:neurosecretory protein VGF n=1 Tax=Gouania willdenowi TaxID=441366 RepID=UPI001054437A|nr:neurosecretory protein VGF-like [Gouania willdenowi]